MCSQRTIMAVFRFSRLVSIRFFPIVKGCRGYFDISGEGEGFGSIVTVYLLSHELVGAVLAGYLDLDDILTRGYVIALVIPAIPFYGVFAGGTGGAGDRGAEIPVGAIEAAVFEEPGFQFGQIAIRAMPEGDGTNRGMVLVFHPDRDIGAFHRALVLEVDLEIDREFEVFADGWGERGGG